MKIVFICCFLFAGISFSWGLPEEEEVHTIVIHFLHGSKPQKGDNTHESKAFGGIHGGHVTLEVDEMEYGFNPTQMPVHIFPKKKKIQASFDVMPTTIKLNGNQKYTSISMTIDHQKYVRLKAILEEYLKKTPYDYAFFGMRCAACTRDILEQLGILKDRSNFHSICKAFYPQRLRRQLLKMADEKGFQVLQLEGRPTRKWEKD